MKIKDLGKMENREKIISDCVAKLEPMIDSEEKRKMLHEFTSKLLVSFADLVANAATDILNVEAAPKKAVAKRVVKRKCTYKDANGKRRCDTVIQTGKLCPEHNQGTSVLDLIEHTNNLTIEEDGAAINESDPETTEPLIGS